MSQCAEEADDGLETEAELVWGEAESWVEHEEARELREALLNVSTGAGDEEDDEASLQSPNSYFSYNSSGAGVGEGTAFDDAKSAAIAANVCQGARHAPRFFAHSPIARRTGARRANEREREVTHTHTHLYFRRKVSFALFFFLKSFLSNKTLFVFSATRAFAA